MKVVRHKRIGLPLDAVKFYIKDESDGLWDYLTNSVTEIYSDYSYGSTYYRGAIVSFFNYYAVGGAIPVNVHQEAISDLGDNTEESAVKGYISGLYLERSGKLTDAYVEAPDGMTAMTGDEIEAKTNNFAKAKGVVSDTLGTVGKYTGLSFIGSNFRWLLWGGMAMIAAVYGSRVYKNVRS